MEWKAKCLEVSGKISNFALVNWKRAPLYKRQALLTSCEDASHVVIRWF